MKRVRTGGTYLARAQQRDRLGAIAIASAGILICVGASVAWHPLAGLLLIPVVVASVMPRVKGTLRARKGALGEELVTTLLDQLPDGYFLVNDVVLPDARGNIDHVLIGPCGVMAIETKRWAGVISCRRDQWFVNGRRVGNISKQVTEGAMAVKGYLRRRHPGLAWVDAVVVFTDPLCRLEIDRPTPTVVRFSQLMQVVLEKGKQRRLSASTAAMMAETLTRGVRDPAESGGELSSHSRR
jgi:hypothetical protein